MENHFLKWLKAGELTVPRLLLVHYRDIGLDDTDLVTLLQLKSKLDQGELFPDAELMAEHMQISKEQAFNQIHTLIKKQVLALETQVDQDGKNKDVYSLAPLYERLSLYLDQVAEDEAVQKQDKSENQLYQMFESEFGRPLSPIEIETISAWIDEDKYSPDLIQMALKQAVLNQVYNLRYIDRILLSWQRKNITTKEQVLKEEQKYRDAKEHNQDKKQDKGRPKQEVPLYDWVKDLKNNDGK